MATVDSVPKEETIVIQLLDAIQEKTSNNSAETFRYLLGAIIPDATIAKISDGYKLLRQSEEYYHSALSLTVYMVENKGSKKEIDSLKDIVDCNKIYEADIRHDRLNLRRLLSNIADELKEEAVRELVNRAGVMLNVNTDHIEIKGESLASALNAFRLLEERGKLDPMLKDHEEALRNSLPLHLLLENMGQKRLNKKYVESFQPHQPMTLAIMKAESK